MIITISRQMGSGGAAIGQALARRFGLRYADRDILAAAARLLEAEAADLEPLEERVETYWERVAHMFARGSVDTLYAPLSVPAPGELDLFATERQIITSIAAEGDAVIVGRGAAHVLGDRPDLVSVFMCASLADRVARARDEYGFRDEEADTLVRRSDDQRARFIRSLTGRDWCDAVLYDLCLNTSAIALDAAVDVAVAFIERTVSSGADHGSGSVTRGAAR
jgi:cytidylate kinase